MQLRRGALAALAAAAACVKAPPPAAPEPPPTPVSTAPATAPEPAAAAVEPAPPDAGPPPEGALRSPLGVSYVVLTAAPAGALRAKVTDLVTAHYTGWLADGTVFDSSLERGQPLVFDPSQVIEGWRDVIPLMAVGDRWKIWVPEPLAYNGQAGMPAGTLVFEIELLAAAAPPPAPAAPPDVAAPPKDARRTKSGLSYRFLAPAKRSGPRPKVTDAVEVHYSGWTTDGVMFDSSVTRGQPATFPVDAVIPGFREGILLMRPGDRLRVWIPGKLAYDGKPSAPQGMLVFDIELLNIAASVP
ncbi:MAG TPA: FKBP-type peptidyl-prolyl cis-trans isomerase [Kofleriaceae bacterium]|nr:FKBP-type peptidyl-prolyl cis-trans isomerase [Kofleriaceae bacterium]